jgi:hypothetical protein
MRTVTLRLPGEDEKTTLIPTTKSPDPNQTTAIIDPDDPLEKAYKRLIILMVVTAVVHTVTACGMIGVFVNKMASGGPKVGVGRVERIASCWTGTNYSASAWNTTHAVSMNNHTAHTTDTVLLYITNRLSTSTGVTRHDAIAYLMVVFFMFSAAFQCLSLIRRKAHRVATMSNAPQWLRYTEYSITASCMMVTILISVGLLDVYLHISVFLFTAVCMFGGLLADYLRHISSGCAGSVAIQIRLAMLASHGISWLCMMIPWAILFTSVYDMQNSTFAGLCETPTGGSNMPWWIWFIVFGQFILFNVFGFVQIYQFHRQFYLNPYKQFLETKRGYHTASTGLVIERSFVFLSLASKSILGWLLFMQVLMQ